MRWTTDVSGSRQRGLVLDATLLNHAARADRIDLLGHYLKDIECWTTATVQEELRAGLPAHPALRRALDADWLLIDPLDTLESLQAYAGWQRRVGAGEGRHRGEASVFACAELRNGIAVTDDRAANRVAKTYGLEAHGTLWLLARLVREGVIVVAAAENFIESLVAEGARLPCRGSDFGAWCARNGMELT
ncbi:hypothetical protein [Streptomyces zingiberis]|uniref:DUF3368 domain-containing protein n=1 Tax=Streptomyces zingiberis TaxID=2053010 RepID=A0ABX1C0V6_9ACTN|nr:hypothetical protein [Streptomyces zingiberis]NJQ03038.1 hypothetical protein [Streptomyces zingiberis]